MVIVSSVGKLGYININTFIIHGLGPGTLASECDT